MTMTNEELLLNIDYVANQWPGDDDSRRIKRDVREEKQDWSS